MKRKSQHQKPLNMFSWMNKFIRSYIKLQMVIRRRSISLVSLNDKLLLYLFINGWAGTKWVVHVRVCYSEGYSHRQAQGNLTLVLLIPNTTEQSFLMHHFGTIQRSGGTCQLTKVFVASSTFRTRSRPSLSRRQQESEMETVL